MVAWLIFTTFAVLCSRHFDLAENLATLGLPTADTFFTETKPSFPNLYCCATLLASNSFTQEVTLCDCQIPVFPSHQVFVESLMVKVVMEM